MGVAYGMMDMPADEAPSTVTSGQRASGSAGRKVPFSCAHKGCHHSELVDARVKGSVKCPACRHRLVADHLLRTRSDGGPCHNCRQGNHTACVATGCYGCYDPADHRLQGAGR